MPERPRKIRDRARFREDFRFDDSRFWFLQEPIRPVVGVGPNGRFHSFGHPLELDVTGFPGNVGFDWPPTFVDGQIWRLDAMTIISVLGADYTGLANGIATGNTVTVAALGAGDLLGNSFYFDGLLGMAVTNGAAGDVVTLRGRRVA